MALPYVTADNARKIAQEEASKVTPQTNWREWESSHISSSEDDPKVYYATLNKAVTEKGTYLVEYVARTDDGAETNAEASAIFRYTLDIENEETNEKYPAGIVYIPEAITYDSAFIVYFISSSELALNVKSYELSVNNGAGRTASNDDIPARIYLTKINL